MRVHDLEGAPPLVRYRLFERGERRLLVVRFDVLRRRRIRDLLRRPDARTKLVEAHIRRSLGIHARRLHESVYLARTLGAALYVVWYRAAPNHAIQRLTSEDVEIVAPSPLRTFYLRLLWLAARRGGAQPVTAKVGNMREEMIAHGVRVSLPDKLEAEGREQAERLGLAAGERMVTLHVRESGWRPFPDADPRACDISTYREAADELVRRGFRVVRIGDPSMTPVDWPGVLDLATSPARTDLLELWCMLHSVFFLGCDSGPTELAKLLGVPMLIVNVKHPQGQYPLRATDMFILKRMRDVAENRVLSLREQLAVKGGDTQLQEREEYVDNTPEEILAAVDEMLEGLESRPPESPAQEEFRRLTMSKKVKDRIKVRNLGEGRIARFFAERHLDEGVPARAGGSQTRELV